MTRFLLRRLLNYLLLLALASFLTFALTSLTFAPLDGLEQRSPRPPQAVIDAKAAELNLDKPIPVRYLDWAGGAVRGDFGTTVAGQPVGEELGRRIGVSLRLLILGTLIGAVSGVVLGAWGAVRQYRLSDRVFTMVSLLLLSIPTFVIANLLILAALKVNSIFGVQLFAFIGETSPDVVGGAWAQFADRLQHLMLPTLTLALGAMAGYSRYQRNAMLDVLGQDFIRTARAKGLGAGRALFRHGLRNAAVPVMTVLGLQIATLLIGAVVIERVFSIPGLGSLLLDKVALRDLPAVQGIVLVLVVFVLALNLLVDLAFTLIDPRLRRAS